MTKADIINDIVQKTGLPRHEVQSTVESLMKSIKDHMTNGEQVYLRGFGSFIVKKRAKKTARNISKNSIIIIPSHYIPAFRPAKSFLAKVAKNVPVQPIKGNS